MTFPDDEEMEQSRDHSVHFEMKRAPKGHMDVLYLSDNTRITQGNRGTLVVVEPVSAPSLTEDGRDSFLAEEGHSSLDLSREQAIH